MRFFFRRVPPTAVAAVYHKTATCGGPFQGSLREGAVSGRSPMTEGDRGSCSSPQRQRCSYLLPLVFPAAWEAAFARRNRRKAAGGIEWRFPRTPAPSLFVARAAATRGGSGCRGSLEFPPSAEAILCKFAALLPCLLSGSRCGASRSARCARLCHNAARAAGIAQPPLGGELSPQRLRGAALHPHKKQGLPRRIRSNPCFRHHSSQTAPATSRITCAASIAGKPRRKYQCLVL